MDAVGKGNLAENGLRQECHAGAGSIVSIAGMPGPDATPGASTTDMESESIYSGNMDSPSTQHDSV